MIIYTQHGEKKLKVFLNVYFFKIEKSIILIVFPKNIHRNTIFPAPRRISLKSILYAAPELLNSSIKCCEEVAGF